MVSARCFKIEQEPEARRHRALADFFSFAIASKRTRLGLSRSIHAATIKESRSRSQIFCMLTVTTSTGEAEAALAWAAPRAAPVGARLADQLAPACFAAAAVTSSGAD